MGDRFSLLESTDSKKGGPTTPHSPPTDRFLGMEVLEPPQPAHHTAVEDILDGRDGVQQASSSSSSLPTMVNHSVNGGCRPAESTPDDNDPGQDQAAMESAQADPTGILSSGSSQLLHYDGSSHQPPLPDVMAPLAQKQQHAQQQHAQQQVDLLPMPPTSAPPPPPPPPPPTPAVCVICNRPAEDGRPLLHFAPVPHDASVMSSAPTVQTFTRRVYLHVFCGKTASILPHVNEPDLEILSKAGLKNKHGTGPEVNASLARTRSACVNPPVTKDKEFYLVREFEAHLAAVRGTSISLLGLIPVASADPYGNWRGPHQQFLLEQQQREQQEREQQEAQEESGDGSGGPAHVPSNSDPTGLGGDVLLGLHPFSLPSSGTDPDPEEDVPAVNDEADHDEEMNEAGSAHSMDMMNGRSSGGGGVDALSASGTTTPSNDKKRGQTSSPSTTSASETEWKIPRKRLTSSSSSSTPSRDGGIAMHPSSSSSLLGSNGTHFLDHPTFPYSMTNGSASSSSYRGTAGISSHLPPSIPDGDGIQPLYHTMLISSSTSSLDPSLLLGGMPSPNGSRSVLGDDGVVRIQCGCGGRHLPRNSSKGMASWRSHFMTKRHQKWLVSQGLTGAV